MFLHNNKPMDKNIILEIKESLNIKVITNLVITSQYTKDNVYQKVVLTANSIVSWLEISTSSNGTRLCDGNAPELEFILNLVN